MNDSFDSQLDRRLREVPLPVGLLARLEEIAANAPVEQHLSQSDGALAYLPDAAIDEQLCDIAVPSRLVDRIQQVVATAALNEQIDAELIDIAVPRSLLASLRTIPWETRRRQIRQWAVAALLMLMLGSGYYGLLGVWLATFQPAPRPELAWIDLDEDPVRLQSEFPTSFVSLDPIAPIQRERPLPEVLTVPTIPASLVGFTPDRVPLSPVEEVQSQLASGWQPWQDLLLLRYGLLGSPSDAQDRLPPLETLRAPSFSGLRPSLSRDFDRQFLLKEGVHPVVAPTSPELCTLQIPLSRDTTSMRAAWDSLRAGRWPEADEMHVADFLAALQVPLQSPAPGEVALRAAAGPSPFGKAGAQLLQVNVAVGDIPAAQRAPMYLTVALDISTSMNLAGRMDTARASLLTMLDQLGPEDRLSLLFFNERHDFEIAAVGREEIRELRGMLNSLKGAGGTNLAAAIQRAASLAMSEVSQPNIQRKLVLLTDGRANLSRDTQEALGQLMSELRERGVQWTIIDLGDGPEPDPQLLALAQASQAQLHRARNQQEGRWLLTDELLGRSTVLASEVTLTLTFDPRAVAAYRLVGHEPSRLAGLAPVVASLDLHAGEAVGGLVELWLRPNSQDDVAIATAQWREPTTGEVRHVIQRISRLQFAPSFAEAPLALQAAAIAAETGEVLKQSPFQGSRARALERVQLVASRVNPRLAESESYQRFVRFIEAAERLRTQRVVPDSSVP
jgi:Ca-activated chloride channel family protein